MTKEKEDGIMADVAIIYHSEHHGNTKKLLDAIAAAHAVDLIAVPTTQKIDLSGYKTVGFASGIYMSKFHKSVRDFIDNQGKIVDKNAFVIFTSGAGKDKFADSVTNALEANGFRVLGKYHCLGYDTFGPFKLVGGIAKNHPTAQEMDQAVKFYEQAILGGK